MAWVTPKTWTAGELVGETDMNTYIRDQQTYLFSPSFQQILTASAGNLTITATTAIPISTADLSITLTTYGGNIHFYFAGRFSGGASDVVRLNLLWDGTAVAEVTTGLVAEKIGTQHQVTMNGWVTGLASGAHTFQPCWNVGGAGQSARLELSLSPALFWVREG